MNRLGRPLGAALAVLLAAGAAYSCAAQQPVPKAADLPPPRVSTLPSALARGATTAPPEPLSLEGFRPLLSDARYEAARLKQEAGDNAAAAELANCSHAAWQSAEYGRRRLDPAAWELFLLRTGQHPSERLAGRRSR